MANSALAADEAMGGFFHLAVRFRKTNQVSLMAGSVTLGISSSGGGRDLFWDGGSKGCSARADYQAPLCEGLSF